MKKSKKILVTSLATATLGLIALSDTTGDFPFSAQHVSAQEKDASKNGKVVKENTTSASNQAEKSKTPAQNPAEKPKTPAQNSAEKPKTPAQKPAEKPKTPAQKPAEKPKTPAQKPAEKPKNTSPKEDKSKSTAQSGWVGSSYYENGTKVTNKWIFDKKANSYFYLNASGNYVQNAWVGNYYLKSDGKMAKSEWIYDKNYGSYYYLTAEGSYARNAWVGNYYLKSNGKRAKNEWIYDNNYGSYYYLTGEGSYARNTWVGNYYLKSDGKMAKAEWIYDKNYGSYYYLTAEGSYARNKWVGNYYLKSDGKMAKNEWVDGGRYYVDSDGKKVKSEWIYDKNYGSYYYLTAEGSYARNKWIGKYYLKSDGKMAKNEWVDGGRYYVDSEGKMVMGKWVDGGRYYVGYDGVWQPKPADGNPYSAALKEAQGYNSIHLSKKRIYNQLIFKGFNSDTAQYAINHLNADYKANALAQARIHLKYGTSSKSEIYRTLTSPNLDNFTKEEANYAIQKLNLPSEGSYVRNKWVGAYYYKSDGKMAKNEWVDGGRYYVESDGKMARNKWVDGGRYYVGYDGVWQSKPADGNPYSAALKEAQSYNRLYLSKKGIYDQLIFKGFNSDTAQYAINHLNANYKANALAQARQHRKYSNLSKTEIYNMLTSPRIDRFTKEEANYAIQHLDD
ncbi:Ltp family lipoprotein [Streptococcus oralis subsp. oralis]|uniref:Ltp family lipoprotein n=1 Tax=Streptococcus oralis TaxID=1303 RepID=UPI0015E626FE|nr:Ltp family lipoprotein [Streptococcus oralis]MBA1350951.1 Ltp family lipoprotein [Streptococcus oralis subsp. oralis]